MFRLVVAGIVGLAVLGAVIVVLPPSMISRLVPGVELVPFLAAVSLAVSLAAAALAWRALRHAARLKADILLLARSIDIALRDVVARTDKEAATLDEMTSAVSREIDRLSERIAARDGAVHSASSGNVVPYPSERRPRTMAANADPPAAQPKALEAAYRSAIAAGEFDISLQPIVSVARGEAVGFEVFANLLLEDGQRIDVRRPAGPASPADAAAFERILLASALQAGRKRLGAASTHMPLHVALSEAILSGGKELDAIAEILRFYPDLARSFVISVPVGLLESPGKYRQALDMFAARSVRVAAEGRHEAANAKALSEMADVSFIKISANRLLDRERPRRRLAPTSTVLDEAGAANIAIIATDVATDEDAVTLLDLGVDLMSGPRFGGPKRFKPDGAGRSGKLALI